MHIFIDESGTFVIPSNKDWSPCVVGALIVPDFKIDQLFNKYARLRQNLPKEKGEVKGKLLSEDQVCAVVGLLRRNSCIFEAQVIEMSVQTLPEIEEHQRAAGHGLTVNLTSAHNPELAKGVWHLRRELEAMSPQLYVQYTIMSELLANLIRDVPVFWAQRRMKELLNFHWVVDGKGAIDLTRWEDWWATVKSGILQSKLAREPMIMLEGLDYSEFEAKFRAPIPTYLRDTIMPDGEGFSLNLLMDESFRFSSGNDYGLELVDILTNACRRALKGNLGRAGWSEIPKLMINRKGQYLRLRSFSRSPSLNAVPYRTILTRDFATGGRPMITG